MNIQFPVMNACVLQTGDVLLCIFAWSLSAFVVGAAAFDRGLRKGQRIAMMTREDKGWPPLPLKLPPAPPPPPPPRRRF